MATDTPDRSVQFIAKLVQLTQDREIRWTVVPAPDESSSQFSSAFVSNIDESQLRIRKVRREVRVDAMVSILGSIAGSSPAKTRMTESVLLEVLDEFGQVSYTFDRTSGLSDLYESAAFSASKVDDLMDSILKRK